MKNDEDLDVKATDSTKPTVSDVTIGDTVAYRTLEDGKPEWACFTVRAVYKGYFFEHVDLTGDNIAIEACYKVGVPRIDVEKENVLPCPFCGKEVAVIKDGDYYHANCSCGYVSRGGAIKEKAIDLHNSVSKIVEVLPKLEAELYAPYESENERVAYVRQLLGKMNGE